MRPRSRATPDRRRASPSARDHGEATSYSWFESFPRELFAQMLEPSHEPHATSLLARIQLATQVAEALPLQQPTHHDTALPLRHAQQACTERLGNLVAVASLAGFGLFDKFERHRPTAPASAPFVGDPAL